MTRFKFYFGKPYLLALVICTIALNSCAQKSIDNPTISGPWLISLFTNDVGKMQVAMYFDVDEKQAAGTFLFHAFTEKNVDRKILGFWKAEAGRLFGSNFEDGSLMRITKGVFSNDSISGVLATPFNNFYLNAAIQKNGISGTLKDGKHKIAGYINGSKGLPKLPLHNYRAIMDKAIAVTQTRLYDPAILNTSGWHGFTKEMKRISSFASDDASFVMAFFYYSHKLLPFSHYSLYRPLDAQENDNADKDKNVTLEQKGPKTMYMRISSFAGTATEMDNAFVQVTNKGYDTLIIDLSDNPGGSIEAGMGFFRHLVRDTIYGGIFLTQKYFITHADAPKPNQYRAFPVFSEANYNLLMKGISEWPGICLAAYPQAPYFSGEVYILTNGNTASTCEPIVYALKQHHLATIVGERTAGAMLCSEHYEMQDGFILTVPTATYYTSDGYKIDKSGVQPDINIKGADALDSVLKHSSL